ncbi:MAG: phenylacetate--CoA ligase family protein [Ruminococcaceae bacterium]|nr:phenylacetate--CoA ligase family protein [Oscillospiraceae bacterium]
MNFSIYKKSREEIADIQLKKMRKVVSVAYEKSDFYHNLYKNSDFHPDMLKTYEDIQKIPIAKRSTIKSTPVESIVTRHDFGKLHLHTTSGSSGIPVKFYYTGMEDLKKNYGVLRAYLTMGMKLTDRTIALRDPCDITKPTLYQKMGIVAYDYYNIYNPVEENYRLICEKYDTIDILKGMPSDLINLCYAIRKENMRFPKVRLLFSDSEVLDDFSRKFITDTIGTEILDFYASVENGCIAFQLPGSKKYFLNEDMVLVENGNGDAQIGDAVITNLRNTTFPIIRYQIGDVIEFGDGKSDVQGMNFKTIDKIQGKYLDFIVLPDKTIISPHVPKQEMTYIKGIKRFQVHQKEIDRITVVIERDVDYSENEENMIIEKLEHAFKNQIKCTVVYDDQLSIKTKNKFKCIQSDVAQQFLTDNM